MLIHEFIYGVFGYPSVSPLRKERIKFLSILRRDQGRFHSG
jgi:hypothetical protein